MRFIGGRLIVNGAVSLALRVTLVYVVFGVAWILFSDWIVLQALSPEDAPVAQSLKGAAFVLVTATMFGAIAYLLARRDHLHLERQQEILTQTVAALSTTLERRDPYTARHAVLVAMLAVEIGRRIGLSDERLADIELGAMLHDIGKIGVPTDLLVKPSRLTDAEFDVVKTHPEIGYDIVSRIRFGNVVPRIVRDHHERLDGSGYPGGLKGDEIDIESQVVAVADVAESMTAHRPYRAALETRFLVERLEKDAGVKLHSAVVRVCISIIRDPDFRLTLENGPEAAAAAQRAAAHAGQSARRP